MRDYRSMYDDEYEAIRAMIENSGKGYKGVAVHLFPHLKMESAYSRLKNSLNPDKDEKLTFGQIIAIAIFCNRADVLFHLCDELGYKRPEIKPVEDENAQLMQKFLEAQQELKKIADRIQKNYEQRFQKEL